jgi:hypothetical protein
MTRLTRTRVKAAALALCGIAAIAGARPIGLRWAAWGSSPTYPLSQSGGA